MLASSDTVCNLLEQVRGVGAGGIVSTAYCLLYKLFTLKLTRKQVNGLITHPDSPYIRALGFMYIRYTQPPADLWDWYDEYLEDPEVGNVPLFLYARNCCIQKSSLYYSFALKEGNVFLKH
ncbi:PRP38 pre-mRNA processing factor 38 domain-containing protein B [Homalodisca vitripennis]|nr:PRP38 pre-mRNA processing factor 38 domain-containing protein B [Homalodisca vitripennis]